MALAFGYALGVEAPESSSGLGGRINLFANIFPHFAIGPEFGYYNMGTDQFVSANDSIVYSYSTQAWHAGGCVRFNIGQGRFRPFVVGGLGFYSLQQNYLGYAVGAGFQVGLGSRACSLHADARWHGNLQSGISSKFFTLMAGIAKSW